MLGKITIGNTIKNVIASDGEYSLRFLLYGGSLRTQYCVILNC